MIDLDGDGPSPARLYDCDMTNGGWTLIANQVPAALLTDSTATLNEAGFGTLTQSYRLGSPDVAAIRPRVAWKLTDATNAVFFKPTCVVDWTASYAGVTVATDCTLGYTSTAMTTTFNGHWDNSSARGIGINNAAQFCSIRMYEAGVNAAGVRLPGTRQPGVAAPCKYSDATQGVALWFQ
jgi:hypothetical protein